MRRRRPGSKGARLLGSAIEFPAWILGAALVLLVGEPALLAAARPMRFEHLTIEDGLSQSAVLSIFQDRQGFMWFGTENGLNRFDGYEFTVFTHDRLDETSLSGNYVWGLDEDSTGALWIATVGAGVSRRDPSTGRFTSYRHDPDEPTSLASDRVRTLHVGADGAIWVGTLDAGLDRLDPVTGVATHYRHHPDEPGSLAHDSVYAIYTDSAGDLWVGTDGGLELFDPATGTFRHFAHDPADPGSLSHDAVRAVVRDRAGVLWVGTWGGGLNRLDPGAEAFRHFRHDPADPESLGDDNVQALFEDDAGRLFVGTSRGISGWNRTRDSFCRYSYDPAQPHGLGADHVMAIFQDRGGVIWFGTRLAGVDRWNPATWSFGHVGVDPGNPDGLRTPNVTAFAEDRAGRLWLGAVDGGLSVLDRVTGEMEHITVDTGRPRGLSSDRVMALAHDHRGALWVGTMGGGLNRLSPDRSRIDVYRHDASNPDSLGSDAIMTVFEDRRGTLWLGTFGGGLERFDADRATFEHYRSVAGDPTSLGSDRVTSLADGPGDWLWVGTDGGGLAALDTLRGGFVQFRHDPGDETTLSSDVVYALHVDSTGALWVGTRGGGLDRVVGSPATPAAVEITGYTDRDGLPDNDIYGIEAATDGSLWLSTNRGLSRFDPRSETFTNYNSSHGLQSDEFHFGSHYASTSGELFFGGVNGFNAFFPERLAANSSPPRVVLTAFLELNRPRDLGPLTGSGQAVELGYKDDVITFEFAALDFAAPEKNRYAYMLEGFDPDWVDIGTVRRVTYTDLDGGDYRFLVRAANNDGVWSETPLEVPLRVAAPPWRTAWAYAAYLLAVVAAVWSFVRVQRAKLRREEAYSRRLEEDVESRTKELAARTVELEDLNDQLLKASLTDSLTGMANRRFLLEWVDKEVAQLQRQYDALAGGSLTRDTFDLVFLIIDLDDFKSINDTCGHRVGDQVLREVKDILVATCRRPDLMIRWGGDEFLVVGRGSTPDGVSGLAERIRRNIEAHAFVVDEGQIVRVTCSIGVACYPFQPADVDALTWDQVINIADVALYAAKGSGRNAWVGLFATESTEPKGLLRAVREAPGELVARGAIEVRSSIEDVDDLRWQPFFPQASPRHPDALSARASRRELAP